MSTFITLNLVTEGSKSEGKWMKWLPNMDLNHDKQIQRLLCYRYTIRQCRKAPVSYEDCLSRQA